MAGTFDRESVQLRTERRRSAAPVAQSGPAFGLLQLQRCAGNRAVAQLMTGGTPACEDRVASADAIPVQCVRSELGTPGFAVAVQRCGAGGCVGCATKQGPEAEEQPTGIEEPSAAPPAQSVPGGVEEYPPGEQTTSHRQTAVQRTLTSGVVAAAPAVQRVATFAAGVVTENRNLATAIITGIAVGYTPPLLNGAVMLSRANARAAIVAPTVATTKVAAGGFDAKVTTVPTNTGSFTESVLAAGPWHMTTPKTTVGALHSTLTMCTGPGDTNYRAIGDPTDAAMHAANRRHEDHHATDHRAAFDSTIKPWDARLTAAQKSGTGYHGATEADAEAALYTAMGGKAEGIADAYNDACLAANNAFHGTPKGGAVEPATDPKANADCSTSSAKYHNPS
jgi:hypothetical protein